MSYLHQLKPHPKARHRVKRVGRGVGSGFGKTSGRGHKGQLARGPGAWPGFEGGQMPLIRTMPKRGFTARAPVRFQIVNVGDLDKILSKDVVDIHALKKQRLVSSLRQPVKILGNGDIKRAINLKVDAASRTALEKIKKAGGACELPGAPAKKQSADKA